MVRVEVGFTLTKRSFDRLGGPLGDRLLTAMPSIELVPVIGDWVTLHGVAFTFVVYAREFTYQESLVTITCILDVLEEERRKPTLALVQPERED